MDDSSGGYRSRPTDINSHIPGYWLSHFDTKKRKIVLVGTVAIYWVILCRRDDIWFNNVKYTSFLKDYLGEHIGCGAGNVVT